MNNERLRKEFEAWAYNGEKVPDFETTEEVAFWGYQAGAKSRDELIGKFVEASDKVCTSVTEIKNQYGTSVEQSALIDVYLLNLMALVVEAKAQGYGG